MFDDELMMKIENVSKVYKLGEIGGTTLRDELQRIKAKLLKKDDPTKKIGAKNYNKGEKFKALDNVSFAVKKGERIGIIGHNGAGKSTLLKLISRVTGPTSGNIYLNGRVASMLEVGTGFHPELTGRENIYMNGAILGMTRKEIDSKMEEIIEFSEVRQFIDTPVKRYSSGMYVKLAFSVAAHLNSEIVIMDEVLAVGDRAFQAKCINKMKSLSLEENRTILYVSHNMNTIKNLCNKVAVLNHGKLVYYGDVDGGISLYNQNSIDKSLKRNFKVEKKRDCTGFVSIVSTELIKQNIFDFGEKIKIRIGLTAIKKISDLVVRATINTIDGLPIISFFSEKIKTINVGDKCLDFELDTSLIAPGDYTITLHLANYINSDFVRHDIIYNAGFFSITNMNMFFNLNWDSKYWGYLSSKRGFVLIE